MRINVALGTLWPLQVVQNGEKFLENYLHTVDPSVLQRVEHGLSSYPKMAKGIPFDLSWLRCGADVEGSERLPDRLYPPSFVRVYEHPKDSDVELEELALHVRQVIDEDLPKHGAVLFRNLHNQIRTVADFSSFWDHVREGTEEETWKTATYLPFGKPRDTIRGVDLATNIPSHHPLKCHNEMAYNPNPPRRIAFYCLQDAQEGGETIVCRNEDLTNSIQEDILDFVKEHGILYERRYKDREVLRNSEKPKYLTVSWQEKCKTENRDEAIRMFTKFGFSKDEVFFNEEDTLVVQNRHSGFLRESASGRDLWYNILPFPTLKTATGKEIPDELRLQIQVDSWRPVCAFKLRPGDWLVLDNLTVQHGRLPYKENPEGSTPRTLLTVYTE